MAISISIKNKMIRRECYLTPKVEQRGYELPPCPPPPSPRVTPEPISLPPSLSFPSLSFSHCFEDAVSTNDARMPVVAPIGAGDGELNASTPTAKRRHDCLRGKNRVPIRLEPRPSKYEAPIRPIPMKAGAKSGPCPTMARNSSQRVYLENRDKRMKILRRPSFCRAA
ncbi:hypothetical protein ACHAWF_006095 [Thalassiosira exigua]